jgi:hypothetical protein
MATFPGKGVVDDDPTEADVVVLPARSYNEILEEWERSIPDQLDRLAEKRKSNLFGDLPIAIEGLYLIQNRMPPWLFSILLDAVQKQARQERQSMSIRHRRWVLVRLLLDGGFGWEGRNGEGSAFDWASKILEETNSDAVGAPETIKKDYMMVEKSMPPEKRRPKTYRPKFQSRVGSD